MGILYFLTLMLWGIAVGIGSSITDLGVVLDFTGALAASLIAYVFPPLIYLRVRGFKNLRKLSSDTWSDKESTCSDRCFHCTNLWFPPFLIVFGILAAVLGVIN